MAVEAAREEVEYPPLALLFFRLPLLGVGPLPPEGAPPRQRSLFVGTPEEEFVKDYMAAYPVVMLAADVLLFLLIIALARRLYPKAGPVRRAVPPALYVLATAALGPLLYTRMDLVLALLVTASLYLLTSRVHWAVSFAVLAAAVNFKLVPLVLGPVWVLGALPADRGPDLFHWRVLGPAALRTVVFVALVAALFAPFYLAFGPDTLSFLTYHADRGLEVGSLYSSLLLALGTGGPPVEVYFAHGSYNVRSPLAPALRGFAPVVGAAALLGATIWLINRVRRLPPPEPGSPRMTLAQAHPVLFLRFALLFLVLFIATNKVFSPQYLLWLVPLACLLPFDTWADRVTIGLFLAVCVLTTLVFPVYFWTDVVGVVRPDGAPIEIHGPTTLGLALLVGRNVLFVGLAVGLVWGIVKDRRPEPEAGARAVCR
jgi:hypothetical protein